MDRSPSNSSLFPQNEPYIKRNFHTVKIVESKRQIGQADEPMHRPIETAPPSFFNSTAALTNKIQLLEKELNELTRFMKQEEVGQEEDLRRQNQELRQRVSLLEEMVKVSQMKASELQTALYESNQHMEDLFKELSDYKSNLNKSSVSRNTSQLQEELVKSNQQIQTLLLKLHQLNTEFTEQQEIKESLTLKIQAMEEEIMSVREENKYLKDQIKKVEEISIDNQNKIRQEKDHIIESLKKSLQVKGAPSSKEQSLQTQIKNLTYQYQSLVSQYEILSSHQKELQLKFTENEKRMRQALQNSDSSHKIENYERTLKRYEAQIHEYQNKLNEYERRINEYQRRNQENNHTKSKQNEFYARQYEGKIREKDNIIRSHQRKIRQYEQKIREYLQFEDQLRLQNKQRDTEKNSFNTQKESLNRQITKLQKEIQNLEVENNKIRFDSQGTEYKTIIMRLQREKSEQNLRLAEQQSLFSMRLKELEAKLVEQKDNNSQLELKQLNETLQTKITQLQCKNNTLQIITEKYESQLTQLSKSLSSLSLAQHQQLMQRSTIFAEYQRLLKERSMMEQRSFQQKEQLRKHKEIYESLVRKYDITSALYAQVQIKVREWERQRAKYSNLNHHISNSKLQTVNLSKFQPELQQLKEQNAYLQRELSSLQGIVNMQNHTLSNQPQASVNAFKRDLQEERLRWKRDLDQSKFRQTKMQSQLYQVKKRLQRQENKWRSQSNRVEQLERQLHRLQDRDTYNEKLVKEEQQYRRNPPQITSQMIRTHPDYKNIEAQLLQNERNYLEARAALENLKRQYELEVGKLKVENEHHRAALNDMWKKEGISQQNITKESRSIQLSGKYSDNKYFEERYNQLREKYAQLQLKYSEIQHKCIQMQQNSKNYGSQYTHQKRPSIQTAIHSTQPMVTQRDLQHLQSQNSLLQHRLDAANRDINTLSLFLSRIIQENNITPRQPTAAIPRAMWVIERLVTECEEGRRDREVAARQKREQRQRREIAQKERDKLKQQLRGQKRDHARKDTWESNQVSQSNQVNPNRKQREGSILRKNRQSRYEQTTHTESTKSMKNPVMFSFSNEVHQTHYPPMPPTSQQSANPSYNLPLLHFQGGEIQKQVEEMKKMRRQVFERIKQSIRV